MPNEIHDFAHRIPAALGSSSRPTASLVSILLLFLLAFSMMLLLRMYIHRRASMRTSMQGMLNGTFHISYNTGLPLAGVRLAPRPESVEERRLSRRASSVIRTTATSSTFRAITATITATGGTGPSTGSLSAAFAGTRRTRRFCWLRKRRRFSRTRCAPVRRLSDRLRVRSPRICSWPMTLRNMPGVIRILGHDRW